MEVECLSALQPTKRERGAEGGGAGTTLGAEI